MARVISGFGEGCRRPFGCYVTFRSPWGHWRDWTARLVDESSTACPTAVIIILFSLLHLVPNKIVYENNVINTSVLCIP